MKIEEIEAKHNYKFPKLYKKLWENGMLNWMGDWGDKPFSITNTWENSIYPTIKNNPPLLLHTGGYDFELLTSNAMYQYKFDELWNINEHHFIPFAKTAEGDVYAFYKNIEIDGENPIVHILQNDESKIIAKNFEDFIFRQMLTAICDVEKDEISADYGDDFEAYRKDILSDLRTISPYINKQYVALLEEFFKREEILEGMFSYGLMSTNELNLTIKKYLGFEQLNETFEHEI
ncbi:MAG TPA: hypothetical protein EYG90_07330 [Campylobacterales bacterium]|nr:hypothetical protein [Campylobacterales bacterium]